MIGKITKGSGFGGVFAYILNEGKKPILLKEAQQCLSSEPEDLAREFQYIANERHRTMKPVRHFSISFAPEDGAVATDIKSEIAVRIMEEMGFGDSQYFAVAHDRDDPNHHHIHNHEHIHIVANAIKPNGEKVDHFWDYRNLERCLRNIEIEYGFRQIPNSWETPRNQKETRLSNLQEKVDEALENSPSLKEWIDRLEKSGVNLRFRLTRTGCVQGISFVHEGQLQKGGDIDRSWRSISPKFEQTPENLELMQSANLKTQSLSVQLRRHEQELLIKAADLAVLKLDGISKFKDKSVEISIVDGVLKVQRLRPNKRILAAKKDAAGEWQSIGIPDIDAKRDLQILGDLRKIEKAQLAEG